MIKPIIVSLSDAGFFDYLIDMLDSVDAVGIKDEIDRGVIDLGLTSDQKQVLISRKIKLASPVPINIPRQMEIDKKQLGGLTRPRYPEIFPDNDPILHIDADAWVQLKSAIDIYISAAKKGSAAVATHHDRAYRTTETAIKWRLNLLSDYASTNSALKILLSNSYYNSGVFCFPRQSSIWKIWEQAYYVGLAQSRHNVVDDQAALNLALFEIREELFPVASVNNWMTHLATPAVHPDQDLLMSPLYPHEPLGIVHMTGEDKARPFVLDIIGDGKVTFALNRRSVQRWFAERRNAPSPTEPPAAC